MTPQEIEALAAERASQYQSAVCAAAAEELVGPLPGDRGPVRAADRSVAITASGWTAVWRVLRFLLAAHFRREIEAEHR